MRGPSERARCKEIKKKKVHVGVCKWAATFTVWLPNGDAEDFLRWLRRELHSFPKLGKLFLSVLAAGDSTGAASRK